MPRKKTIWILFEDWDYDSSDFLGAFSSASVAQRWFEKTYAIKPEWEKVSTIWWRTRLRGSSLRLQRASIIDNAFMKEMK